MTTVPTLQNLQNEKPKQTVSLYFPSTLCPELWRSQTAHMLFHRPGLQRTRSGQTELTQASVKMDSHLVFSSLRILSSELAALASLAQPSIRACPCLWIPLL
jgi:hypothetical protein